MGRLRCRHQTFLTMTIYWGSALASSVTTPPFGRGNPWPAVAVPCMNSGICINLVQTQLTNPLNPIEGYIRTLKTDRSWWRMIMIACLFRYCMMRLNMMFLVPWCWVGLVALCVGCVMTSLWHLGRSKLLLRVSCDDAFDAESLDCIWCCRRVLGTSWRGQVFLSSFDACNTQSLPYLAYEAMLGSPQMPHYADTCRSRYSCSVYMVILVYITI